MADYRKSAYYRVPNPNSEEIDTQVHNSSRVLTVHHQLGNPGPSFETQPSAGLLEPNMTVITPELHHIQPLPEPMLIDNNAQGESSTTGHK